MSFFFSLLVSAGIYFAVPLLFEGASDACSAFSSRAVSLITTSNGDQNVLVTFVTATTAQLFVSGILLPELIKTSPEVSCTNFYWYSLFDPQIVTDSWKQFQSSNPVANSPSGY